MRILKLEVVGFKSFADKVKLLFGEGITGIVGPNGCGKSNVVDAIRWCMGEMSAKHLRGKGMQDVIFGGSTNRGPQGMAEVTLTFKNDGNVPPTYAQYEEIAVTRRLHRDGTSDYLINKVSVRLRDVVELFMGTGVGTRAYSIIEQNRIGFVINAKPEERRALIEEVAGITKFKARKKAAERRMESTEQNLARVQDIVAELERQLGSLRRQAKKAEKYKELKARLREIDLHVSVVEFLRIQETEQQTQQNLLMLEQQFQDSQRGVVSDEASLEAQRLHLIEEERRLQREQLVVGELETRLTGLEKDLEHWKNQVQEMQARRVMAKRELDEAQERLAGLDREKELCQTQAAQLESTLMQQEQGLNTLQESMFDIESELATLDEELDLLRKNAMEHIQGAAKNKALAQHIQQQRADLKVRYAQAQQALGVFEPQALSAQTKHTQLEQRFHELETLHANKIEHLTDAREQFQHISETVKQTTQALKQEQTQYQQKASRLQSLEEIAKRLEGFSDGVRTLKSKQKEAPIQGLGHLVTDILKVPSHLEQAIEAVLGEKLQYILTDSQTNAVQAIEYLKKHQAGKSGFISPVHPTHTTNVPDALAQSPGCIGRAHELIQVDKSAQPILVHLLGKVFVVDSLETALHVFAKGWWPHTLVTLQGEVIDEAGILVGGSHQGTGLLASRREIRELSEHVAVLKAKVDELTNQLQHQEQQKTYLEAEVITLDREVHRLDLERVTARKDVEAIAAEMKRLQERLTSLREEVTTLSQKLITLDEEEHAILQAAASAEAGKEDLEWRIADVQERRQIVSQRFNAKNANITSYKVQMAAQQEQWHARKQEMLRFGQIEADLHQRIERNQKAIQDANTFETETSARIEHAQVLLHQTLAELQTKKDILLESRKAYEQLLEETSTKERLLKDLRKGAESVQETLMQNRLTLERLEMERTRLIETIFERQDIDLRTVIETYQALPPPTDEAFEERAELERSIKSMGPIHLTAIEECAEVETRHDFLVKQRDDLMVALDSLRKAIAKINQASKERFHEAFDAVNEMFQKVYPRLFRGGTARLELVQTEDLLEAGIDIVAQPPGKKLQNVNLMSGGEKALTATALVFSIFLIKPSPFCILDEVDAPLDEANVNRFNEMLREISKISQFIVITHNKNTMQQADRLYGITMEEPGVSKVVSVNLEDKRGERAA